MKKKINSLLQNLRFIATLLFLILFLSQCATSEKSYFPLEIERQYTYTGKNQNYIKTIISKPVDFNGLNYILVDKFGYFQSDKSDTSFYREESNGMIMEYINFNRIIFPKEIIPDSIIQLFDFNSNEQLRYNFNINIGQSYPILIKTSDIKVNGLISMAMAYMTMVNKDEKIQVKNRIYNECIRFDYRFITASDFDFSEWFAEGIGLVKIEYPDTKESFYLKN